ncbi:hypothetical protein IGI04_008644 [Brassica rapa subsp. trilocularis]|uniref:Uncharacterized protein n=1 Tax=Brassica rapa subsp. trilocularis TaxID=1813537 RepID=A0ABQ7NN72_BRACM|nr:hypothetical protein IGI04_008644 [Brassica rapa subsp. trilocularis]
MPKHYFRSRRLGLRLYPLQPIQEKSQKEEQDKRRRPVYQSKKKDDRFIPEEDRRKDCVQRFRDLRFWLNLLAFSLKTYHTIPVEIIEYQTGFRYGNGLPRLDIFHSMADLVIEPLLMMVNTVLSVLALVYPPKNLVVYLSDDASSQLTFYALTEAAEFAKTWVPFCKEFDIEPRSSLLFWQGLKVDEAAVDNRGGMVEVRCRLLAVGFCSYSKKTWNHSSKEKENIIVIPTLVYPSREKRPEHHQ